MRLLLISNSTMAGEAYLEYPKKAIGNFLGENVKRIVFIPYAAVTFSYDAYVDKVNERFNELGYTVSGIHTFENKPEAIRNADAIVVGGGNTWHLLRNMRTEGLLEPIREKVKNGTPYIGWSAGSNVACPTIMTTNDMPIIDPLGFDALGLIAFQINPHYLDANPDGHAGETREQRIEEFLAVNHQTKVLGLREGSMLLIDDGQISLQGLRSARVFAWATKPVEMNPGSDLSFLV
ncbi:MAG: dipeptidase PepE [Prolixibacteraceae bacterium]|nr:dipeptidase PepE [Prolixibacteraceae bacterium]